MKAGPLLREKRILLHRETGEVAVAELKVWSIPKSPGYPNGRRYSLFLVSRGRTLVGFDNHSPKGPHLHLGGEQLPYPFRGEKELLADFWDLVRKAGYEP